MSTKTEEGAEKVRSVEIHRESNSLGLSITGPDRESQLKLGLYGIFVSRVSPGGPADLTKEVFVGDQILSVNGISIERADSMEAMLLLKNSGDVAHLTVIRNVEGLAKYAILRENAESAKESGSPTITTMTKANTQENSSSSSSSSNNNNNSNNNTTSPVVSRHNNDDDEDIHAEAIDETQPRQQQRQQQQPPPPRSIDDIIDNEEDQMTKCQDQIFRMTSVAITQEHYSHSLLNGLIALIHRQYAKAVELLFEALGTVVDDALEKSIMMAVSTSDPVAGKRSLDQAIQESEREKGGVLYLLGLALFYNSSSLMSLVPLRMATYHMIPWCYYPGIVIDVDDADFHLSIAPVLFQHKMFEAAYAALYEIRKSYNIQEKWTRDLDRMFGPLFQVSTC